jgi:hypothetical protein
MYLFLPILPFIIFCIALIIYSIILMGPEEHCEWFSMISKKIGKIISVIEKVIIGPLIIWLIIKYSYMLWKYL